MGKELQMFRGSAAPQPWRWASGVPRGAGGQEREEQSQEGARGGAEAEGEEEEVGERLAGRLGL